MASGDTPGRSNATTNSSPTRYASMGIAVGLLHVPGTFPNTCWVRRSSSRNGSVRISIANHSFLVDVGRDAPEQHRSNTEAHLGHSGYCHGNWRFIEPQASGS